MRVFMLWHPNPRNVKVITRKVKADRLCCTGHLERMEEDWSVNKAYLGILMDQQPRYRLIAIKQAAAQDRCLVSKAKTLRVVVPEE
ncbi:unnamed protein product [Pieris macdunnoughi]|uniref:Uncharacterized protein n=1 Tax=Pieris macdunnoughi TaxID=345717 RepID=A0A821RHY6_9NEOP|nr:unnamed protein product [Pieris macdunnoughi]